MPEDDEGKLSITNMFGGGAVEQIDKELQKALDDISDINTTLDRRVVTITIGLKPTPDRTFVEFDFEPKAKLASTGKHTFSADLKMDTRGRTYAVDRVQQRKIPFNTNVTSMEREETSS